MARENTFVSFITGRKLMIEEGKFFTINAFYTYERIGASYSDVRVTIRVNATANTTISVPYGYDYNVRMTYPTSGIDPVSRTLIESEGVYYSDVPVVTDIVSDFPNLYHATVFTAEIIKTNYWSEEVLKPTYSGSIAILNCQWLINTTRSSMRDFTYGESGNFYIQATNPMLSQYPERAEYFKIKTGIRLEQTNIYSAEEYMYANSTPETSDESYYINLTQFLNSDATGLPAKISLTFSRPYRLFVETIISGATENLRSYGSDNFKIIIPDYDYSEYNYAFNASKQTLLYGGSTIDWLYSKLPTSQITFHDTKYHAFVPKYSATMSDVVMKYYIGDEYTEFQQTHQLNHDFTIQMSDTSAPWSKISTDTTYNLRVSITDSRGKEIPITYPGSLPDRYAFTVHKYDFPVLSVTANRCDASGYENPVDTYVKFTAYDAVLTNGMPKIDEVELPPDTPVGSKNVIKKVTYITSRKNDLEHNYTPGETGYMIDGNPPFDAANVYTLTIKVWDIFTVGVVAPISDTVNIPDGQPIIHLSPVNRGMAIGKMLDKDSTGTYVNHIQLGNDLEFFGQLYHKDAHVSPIGKDGIRENFVAYRSGGSSIIPSSSSVIDNIYPANDTYLKVPQKGYYLIFGSLAANESRLLNLRIQLKLANGTDGYTFTSVPAYSSNTVPTDLGSTVFGILSVITDNLEGNGIQLHAICSAGSGVPSAGIDYMITALKLDGLDAST